jgi:GT2 family glycosyltransferase
MKYSPITFCISTYNNIDYLMLAIESVRKNSYFKEAPFIIHAENCTDKTNEWLIDYKDIYNLEIYIENNTPAIGIGGGMNFCADKVRTEYICFLHSDFYVSENWDLSLLSIFMEEYENDKLWVSSFRIEPDTFGNGLSRPGTVILKDFESFGMYFDTFNQNAFLEFAELFKYENVGYRIPKGEGVSGLIRKKDWDEVGGNDPQFAPTSWEDMDLFLRMLKHDFKFITTGSSVVWHFGARGSHALEKNNGKSSPRQIKAEQENQIKFIQKWGGLPDYNHVGMIKGIK